MTNPLDGLLSGRDPLEYLINTTRTQDKPLPQIRGKRIDGVLYVRAEDVAEALASQAPEPNARLIKKLRDAA